MIELSEVYHASSRYLEDYTDCRVQRVKKDITYDVFFKTFLISNQPCIFESEFTDNWKSRYDWVKEDGMPNFEFLSKTFGTSKVPVADCNYQFYNAQKKSEDTFCNFIQYWEKYCNSGYPDTMPCLYLKDWHFTRDFPDYEAYHWPFLFASDWLNEFWATKSDDYRFVYMGPKGSWTPLHADVLTSYSWSSNICGRKRWLLFPPGNEKNLQLKFGDLPYDFTLTADKDIAIEVEQKAGETIFIPSGWYHQVWNLEDTISINHNWLNGCCIAKSWAGLQKQLLAVRKELADCKDMEGWEDQCQIVLAATTGTNLDDFFHFLMHIARTRIQCLKGVTTIASAHWLLGRSHAKYDLERVLDVLPLLAEKMSDKSRKVIFLMNDIKEVISN